MASKKSKPHREMAVYFGGFKQPPEPDKPNAFSEFVTKKDCDHRYVSWKQRNDPLSSALLGNPPRIHIVAFSIGCHPAIRFADALVKESPGSLGEIHLLAPDPKYRPLSYDNYDKKQPRAKGLRKSAYEEAADIWGVQLPDGRPGNEFEKRLRNVIQHASLVRIVYSQADEVAEWNDNVAILHVHLPDSPNLDWVEFEFDVHSEVFRSSRIV